MVSAANAEICEESSDRLTIELYSMTAGVSRNAYSN